MDNFEKVYGILWTFASYQYLLKFFGEIQSNDFSIDDYSVF